MPRKPKAAWLFDTHYQPGEPPAHIVKVVDAAIEELNELAVRAEERSGMQVLDQAPGLYEGPVNEQAALALTYEAAATWLFGQLWGGPDRDALLEVMAN